MHYLRCPYCCQHRDESEFKYGGEALKRPSISSTDQEWTNYLFFRKNIKGLLNRERWLHIKGCNRWFNVDRDTRSHMIVATYEITES